MAITELELRKIRHDQAQIWLRLIQPVLWLPVFGVTFSTIRVFPTGINHLQFLTPGILAQSAFSLYIVWHQRCWERDLGLA